MEKLNFGSFCNLVNKRLKKNVDIQCSFPLGGPQNKVIYLLYRCVETEEYIEGYLRGSNNGGYASSIFGNSRSVASGFCEDISKEENEERILKYIKNVFCRKVFWDKLICDLVELSEGLSELDIIREKLCGNNSYENQAYFFMKCLQYAASVPNDFKAELGRQRKAMIEKYDAKTGDPFGLNSIKSNSKALCLTVEGDFLIEEPYNIEDGILYFHHFESCIEFIMQEGLAILKVEVLKEKIRIVADKTGFIIKRINKPSYMDIINFLQPYDESFERKVAWGGGITSLAKGGFEEEKWIPYGYFDKEKLIAFCDYKHRVDKDIELGIMLIDEPYRKMGLGTSLLYLYRLKFFASDIFSGTHEGNSNMIETFKKAGFKELIFEEGNEKVIKGTNRILDRINKEKPYSEYFIAKALWKK